MIDRDRAKVAVDEAFSDGVKHLFGVLVQGLTAAGESGQAADRFAAGVKAHGEARAAAIAAIDSFPSE